MTYRQDDAFVILTCWWVALKFEQPRWQESIIVTASAAVGLYVRYRDMVLLEAMVLDRMQFQIPFRTPGRELWERLRLHTLRTSTWIFALLIADAFHLFPVDEWLALIHDHAHHRCTPLLLYTLADMLPRKLAAELHGGHQPRIGWKRTRATP